MASRYSTARNYLIAIVIPLFCFMLPPTTLAEDVRGIDVTPDTEKRSSIHALDAYVQLSENMSIKETRAAAWAEAKRQALEMARTYITSKTKVEDFEVKYDLVWSRAEGAVKILEQTDHGIENNSRYHVWIKAEVEYGLQTKSGVDPEQAMDPGLPLKVKVWTSRKAYRAGENIEVSIQGNRDFYARVVDITSDGNIIQLLPNDYRKGNFFRAGIIYKIPDKEDGFQLKVAPPFGEDNVIVYASEVPLGDIATENMDRGLNRYRGTQGSLAASTRGIGVFPGSSDKGSGAEFYEASWSLRTSR